MAPTARRMFRRVALSAVLLLLLAGSAARAAEVYTRIDEREIPLQGRTEFAIGIRGASVLPMRPVLRAEGLLLVAMGTSRRVTVINGRMQLQVEWRYRVIGTSPGRHVIPEQTLSIDGRIFRTSPVRITVSAEINPRDKGEERDVPGLPGDLTERGLTAMLRPERISQDQVAELIVAVSGDAQPDLALPEIPGVETVAHPENPSAVRRNGETIWVHLFHLLPYTSGRIAIPALELDIGGRRRFTRALQLTVTPPRETSAVLMLDADQVYLGQPVVCDMVWRRPNRVLEYDLMVPWIDSLPGFAVRKVERIDGKALRNINEDPNGPEVLVSESRGGRGRIWTFRRVLVPLESGSLTIPGARGEITVPPGFGGGSVQPMRLQATTAPASLRVRPLPEEGRPDGLAGPAPVGTFRVSASADPAEATVGDAFELIWRVEGRGNFESVFLEPVGESAELAVYPQESEIRIGPDGLEGVKLFRQTVSPKHARVRSLPGFRLGYFDPEEEAWHTAVAAPVPVTVHPAAISPAKTPPPGPSRAADIPTPPAPDASAPPETAPAAAPAAGTAEELLPVEEVLRRRARPPWRSPLGLGLLILPPLLVLLSLIVRYRENLLAADPARDRRRHAFRNARRQLQELSKESDRIPAADFYLRGHALLVDYIAARTDRPAGELTAEDAGGILTAMGVPEAMRSDLVTLLGEADRARFDGLDRPVESRSDFLHRSEALLRGLERVRIRNGGSS